MGEDQPGLFASLESSPQAEDWQYSRPEVMDEGRAGGNAEEEVIQRAILGTGQGQRRHRHFVP